MSGLEIERKFLILGDDYKRQSFSSSRIIQGYICRDHGRTVRVRRRGDKAYLTIKSSSEDGGLSRYEFEKEITIDEADHLFKICEPGIVDKIRYLVRCGSHIFEIDEFYGANEGLVLGEVELGSVDEEFEKPDFLGVEVTGDHRFYNSYLSRNPFSLWKDALPKEFQK